MATKRQKELYRQVFNKILNTYTELKSVTGSLSCSGLYQSIGRQGAGKTTFNSSVIRATPSDFICEIERIATNTLNAEDLVLYRSVYELGQPHEDWRLNKHRIQEELGKQYVFAELHPVEQYFKPKDIR